MLGVGVQPVDRRQRELRRRRVAAVDGRLRDARGGRDARHGHALEPVLEEHHLDGRTDDRVVDLRIERPARGLPGPLRSRVAPYPISATVSFETSVAKRSSMPCYPRTIDNGHGEPAHVPRRPGRPPAGPFATSHPALGRRCTSTTMQTESMTVEAGRSACRSPASRSSSAAPARPSPSPPASSTASGTPATTELVMTGEVHPPHNLEYFLTQVFASTKAHGGRPGAFDGAFLDDPLPRRVHADRDPRRCAASRAPDPGLPRPPSRPLRPLRGRPDSGPTPFERYTPGPHDQRP